MKYRLSTITPKIAHIEYKLQRSLNSSFLRFQEYYESPEFCGKIFTLKEFKKWYVTQWPKESEKPVFTYYSDWNGFNLPSPCLKPFYEGSFNPLTKNERVLLAVFEKRFKVGKDFCIVGTYTKSDPGTLKHDTAPGLYFTCPQYKERVIDALSGLKSKNNKIFEKFLKSNGYHPKVWEDEKHAYLLANSDWLAEQYKISGSDAERISKKLNALFDTYLSQEKTQTAAA